MAEYIMRKLLNGAAAIELINDLRGFLDDTAEECALVVVTEIVLCSETYALTVVARHVLRY